MKQLLQNVKNGEVELTEVPRPRAVDGHLLIRTTHSLISAGTERMLLEFGRASLMGKVRQQPDKVREVRDKIFTDGLLPTLDAVRNKLDQPMQMGYCNVGVVVEVGVGVTGFSPGDRVASNGRHAEIVSVPGNLCVRIPTGVNDDQASFTVLGAIALQGVRLAQPTLGECFVVTGLGLIGLMTVQILRAHGCRVLGIDLDAKKLALARDFGAETVDVGRGEDPISAANRFSRGRGVDGVLLTLSARSSEPVSEAARMCRKRGRIVLVGVTGLELSRADFYEKELSFQVSCSYGPGRYDPDYEQNGHDYPVGFVRWTVQRNFEAVLDMMSDRRLDTEPLVSARFPLDRAKDAYQTLYEDKTSLGILIDYPASIESAASTLSLPEVHATSRAGRPTVSFIGAGNYAGRILIPAFKEAGAELLTLVSSGGVSGGHYGRKYGFRQISTDAERTINDPEASVAVVATRHDSHAVLVCQALAAGKHVFVEKPLALTRDELDGVERAYLKVNGQPQGGTGAGRTGQLLMVGFNRRFAPQVVRVKELLDTVGSPKSLVMTVNAGTIPRDHWTQDPAVGGGRIIGEACHFFDLLRHLVGAPVVDFKAIAAGQPGRASSPTDIATVTIKFAEGSFGTVHYLSNGHKSFPKERLEVFCAGRVLQLDNFRKMRGYGWPGFRTMNLWRQDKGQAACARAFMDSVRSGDPSPIPFAELIEIGRLTIEIADAL